jgi:hypothetical protein
MAASVYVDKSLFQLLVAGKKALLLEKVAYVWAN